MTKYINDKIGHQADHFVVTLGRTNTVYVDDNVEAGDILFADIPYIDRGTDNNPLMFASSQAALSHEDGPLPNKAQVPNVQTHTRH